MKEGEHLLHRLYFKKRINEPLKAKGELSFLQNLQLCQVLKTEFVATAKKIIKFLSLRMKKISYLIQKTKLTKKTDLHYILKTLAFFERQSNVVIHKCDPIYYNKSSTYLNQNLLHHYSVFNY